MSAELLGLLDELDAAREKATPGEWYQARHIHVFSENESRPGIGQMYIPADAALIVAAVNNLPKLTAALRAVLAEHRPMANSPGYQPACPDCLGGIYADDHDEPRSCGCWGLSTPVCSSCCEQPSRRRYPLLWPCPTVQAITAALTPEQADR